MDWPAILAAVGTGLAVVLAASFAGLRKVLDAFFDRLAWRVGRSAPSATSFLMSVAEYDEILHIAQSLPTVGRTVVFVGRNCGGLPTVGKPYTVKGLTGWSNTGERIGRRFAFDLEIDEEYADMLRRVHRDGGIALDVARMPPSLLRRIYRQEGVKYSHIYQLWHSPETNEFVYASFAGYDGPISEGDLSQVELLVARLRSAIPLGAAGGVR